MDKQKFIIALQSKINLLQKRFNESQEKQDHFILPELDVKIRAYREILETVNKGTFDKS